MAVLPIPPTRHCRTRKLSPLPILIHSDLETQKVVGFRLQAFLPDFIQLDAGSEWATYATTHLLLREDKLAEAREAVKKMSTNPQDFRDLLQACLMGPTSELERLARVAQTAPQTEVDSESNYDQGAIFAYCGKRYAALHMLGMAIQHNYCAYTALQTDPLLVKLRGTTEFKELLSSAKECQNRILAQQHRSLP
jgi:hypothetical protein